MKPTPTEMRKWLVDLEEQNMAGFREATFYGGPSLETRLFLAEERVRGLYATVCTLLAAMAEDAAEPAP